MSVSVVLGKGLTLCTCSVLAAGSRCCPCCWQRQHYCWIWLKKKPALFALFYILANVVCLRDYFFFLNLSPCLYACSHLFAPPAFAGLTNTFISSHKNCTNIELTTMMLEQRKGLLLQPVTRICWHILLVSLWYPRVRGLLQLPWAQAWNPT